MKFKDIHLLFSLPSVPALGETVFHNGYEHNSDSPSLGCGLLFSFLWAAYSHHQRLSQLVFLEAEVEMELGV